MGNPTLDELTLMRAQLAERDRTIERLSAPVSDEEINAMDPGVREVDFADALIAARAQGKETKP